MNGSPIKRAAVRREPQTPRKSVKHDQLLTPSTTPQKTTKLNFDTELVTKEFNSELPVTAPPTPTKTDETKHLSNYETKFFRGKALFQRGSRIRKVVGRVEERKFITAKLEHCLSNHASGALYVSGLPGTGKSALVAEILGGKVVLKHRSCRIATINCMTIDKPDQTYAVIAKEFGYLNRRAQPSKAEAIEQLNLEFKQKNVSHVLVLDELDRIVTTNQEILFRIFEWACGTGTNLVVIGIANAIDLTDRFLPRLQAHKLKPEIIAFKPYTAQGITEIIEARLAQLGENERLMHPAAVRICAVKTAANSGDLRKAFDVCRRAIEVVEDEVQKRDYDEEEKDAIVTTRHVAKVCQVVFSGVDARERLRTLNFQQQAVLCVLMKTERRSTVPNLRVLQAFEEYELRCTNNPVINSLSYLEYLEVVNALEAAGLVAVTGFCGKKGLGSHSTNRRVRRGAGGTSCNATGDGNREDYGLRKISSRAQLLDVVNDLSSNDALRSILLD